MLWHGFLWRGREQVLILFFTGPSCSIENITMIGKGSMYPSEVLAYCLT
jgi:hypothetical protein